jgi:phosphomannomutase
LGRRIDGFAVARNFAGKSGATIIAEVKCSRKSFRRHRKNGGNPIMWKAGHSLIKAKMKETGAALAGEMSGHIFFADRFYGFDDATYAGARVLEILSKTDKTLSELLSDLPETFSTPELRVDCAEEKNSPSSNASPKNSPKQTKSSRLTAREFYLKTAGDWFAPRTRRRFWF